MDKTAVIVVGQGNLGGDESEDFYATRLDKTCRDNEAMSRNIKSHLILIFH